MKHEFQAGQRYRNVLNRIATILAVDDIEVREPGLELCVKVIAYRYDDGTVTHLRLARDTKKWVKE